MDLAVLFVLGLVGFVLRRYGLPVVPVIIGVILGPLAEQQMRRAFQLSDGDVAGLFDTPFSITVYAVVAVVLLWPLVHRLVRRRPPAGEVADRAEGELDSHSGEERHGHR